jgi:hypothetical protein
MQRQNGTDYMMSLSKRHWHTVNDHMLLYVCHCACTHCWWVTLFITNKLLWSVVFILYSILKFSTLNLVVKFSIGDSQWFWWMSINTLTTSVHRVSVVTHM